MTFFESVDCGQKWNGLKWDMFAHRIDNEYQTPFVPSVLPAPGLLSFDIML
jgi:hypothetical protein